MRKNFSFFFSTRKGIIITGIIIGILATLLQKLGNPPNMGICVACFERDIAGALGLHRASVVQYLRPEIPGMLLGSTAAALIFGEFKSRGGSAPLIRFFLGLFAMIGALTFLGCPWRAILRLSAGDLNALTGIAGLAAGITVGVQFLKHGYSLGRASKTSSAAGWIMPGVMILLILMNIFRPVFTSGGAIFFSEKGPGSMAAPVLASVGFALIIGFLAQRSRFCTMGSLRDVILMRDTHLMSGLLALLAAAFVMNLLLGQFNPGLKAQPVAHSSHLWNFLGMVLSGLAFALAGGCPGRQLFLSGEGDTDSAIFVLGMISGAAFSHNFSLAGKPDSISDGSVITGGISGWGMAAVAIGILFCLAIGFAMTFREVKTNE